MSSKRVYIHYLRDIVDAMDKALRFTEDAKSETFLEDEKTVFAVIRALEVIGEAVKSIPEPVRLKYPKVPWQAMAGMRDKLIHKYFGVDLETVWKTVEEDLPALLPLLKSILENEGKGK